MCKSNMPQVPKNRIHVIRMLAHYTQEDLAHLLKVPVQLVSKWENWQVTPSVYYAIGLSVAFHRLVDEIFPEYRENWVQVINQRAKTLQNKKSKL